MVVFVTSREVRFKGTFTLLGLFIRSLHVLREDKSMLPNFKNNTFLNYLILEFSNVERTWTPSLKVLKHPLLKWMLSPASFMNPTWIRNMSMTETCNPNFVLSVGNASFIAFVVGSYPGLSTACHHLRSRWMLSAKEVSTSRRSCYFIL